jgi:hypothetical protein
MGNYKIVSYLFVLLGLILIAGTAYMILSYPTTSILPFMYIGVPLMLAIVSVLMFMGGVYYHRGKSDDEQKKHEDLEREVVHNLVQKINRPGPAEPPPVGGIPGIPPDEEMAPPQEDPPAEAPAPPVKSKAAKAAKTTKKRS